ncbi:hypothetical protein HY450_02635 [Candidatus Pacearchaeota archaeon]|nr:hypothetical protein [Candidatus Pacearchaeota archaeon]
MFFHKKEDKGGLPDLPPLPEKDFGSLLGIKEIDDDEDLEGHSLPSFPDSPVSNKSSQDAIKDAVKQEEEKKFNVLEMEEWKPTQMKYDNFKSERSEMPIYPRKNFEQNKKQTDVFVKIDKFRTAQKSLNEIEEKLEEINEMIKKIREIKMREEQEISSWEKDIAHVRARIKDVSSNIFEKVE